MLHNFGSEQDDSENAYNSQFGLVCRVLDSALLGFDSQNSEIHDHIYQFGSFLTRTKYDCTPEAWASIVVHAREHPLRKLLHQDPLSWRCYSMPRGYQGDADLLDLIYKKNYVDYFDGEVTVLGKKLFSFTINRKAPEAVRERRILLAQRIDEISTIKRHPHILSVACGHLRELQDSIAIQEKGVGRFVGLDQDSSSVALIKRELEDQGVESVRGSVKTLLRNTFGEGSFDFVYAAGLYDYLNTKVAKRLTDRMLSMLRPGGRLLVANYLPKIEDEGYMDIYMKWSLIFRNDEEMLSLVEDSDRSQIAACQTFHDSNSTVVYLEVTKS